MDKPATRICRDCGIEKPLDRNHFTPSKGYAWDFRPVCKDCRNTALAARRQADPEYAAECRRRVMANYYQPEVRARRLVYFRERRQARKSAVDTRAPVV